MITKEKFLKSFVNNVEEIKDENDLIKFFKDFIDAYVKPYFNELDLPDIALLIEDIKGTDILKNVAGKFNKVSTLRKTNEYEEYTTLNLRISKIEHQYSLVRGALGEFDEKKLKTILSEEDYKIFKDSVKRLGVLEEELKVVGYFKKEVWISVYKKLCDEFLASSPKGRLERIPDLLRTVAHEYRHYAQYYASRTKTKIDLIESNNKDFDKYKIINKYSKKALETVNNSDLSFNVDEFLTLKDFVRENDSFFRDNLDFSKVNDIFRKIDAFENDKIVLEYLGVGEYLCLEHEVDARMFSNDLLIDLENELKGDKKLYRCFSLSNSINKDGEDWRFVRASEFYYTINQLSTKLGNDLLLEIAKSNNFELKKEGVNLMSFAESFKAKQMLLASVLKVKAKGLEKLYSIKHEKLETKAFIKNIQLSLYEKFVKNGIAFGCEAVSDVIGENLANDAYFKILKFNLNKKTDLCEESFYKINILSDEQNEELLRLCLNKNQFRYAKEIVIQASEREREDFLNIVNVCLKDKSNFFKEKGVKNVQDIIEFSSFIQYFYSQRALKDEAFYEKCLTDKILRGGLDVKESLNLELYVLKNNIKQMELNTVNKERDKKALKQYSDYEEYRKDKSSFKLNSAKEEDYMRAVYGGIEIQSVREEKQIRPGLEL